jgi:hypothetical protein
MLYARLKCCDARSSHKIMNWKGEFLPTNLGPIQYCNINISSCVSECEHKFDYFSKLVLKVLDFFAVLFCRGIFQSIKIRDTYMQQISK